MSRYLPSIKLAISRVSSPSIPTMSPSQVLQLTPQMSIDSFATLSPESKGGDAGGYRSNEERGDQSGGRISRGQSRRSTGTSGTLLMLTDPPRFDSGELRKANGRSHRTGRSSANLQNTLCGNASRRVVRRMGSRKLKTHETFALVLRLP